MVSFNKFQRHCGVQSLGEVITEIMGIMQYNSERREKRRRWYIKKLKSPGVKKTHIQRKPSIEVNHPYNDTMKNL